MKLRVIAVGQLKDPNLLSLIADYTKRLKWSFDIVEAKDIKALEAAIKPNIDILALDEKGKDLPTLQMAQFFQSRMNDNKADLQIVIGAADGLPKTIKDKACAVWAFGKQTWPHMMVRLMLVEQIYRCQQILSGHPYHREG